MWLLANGSAKAAASFEVTLSDSRNGGAAQTIVDGGAGDADSTVNNSITVSGLTVGGYQFNGVLTTTNSPGGSGIATDSGQFNVIDKSVGAFTGAGTAALYASASGFNDPTGPNIFAVTTSTYLQNGTSQTTGSGTVTSYYDSANTVSTTPTGTLIGSAGPTPASLITPSTGTGITFPITIPSNYALNLLLQFAMVGSGGDFSTTSQVTLFGIGRGPNPTPEPATLAMWGLGALGFAAVRFRRRKA